jgi:hypothetical protein
MFKLKGSICNLKISGNDYMQNVYIIDVIQPHNIETSSTRFIFLYPNGQISRHKFSNDVLLLLTIEEQIKEFNNTFYKYVDIPKHLKKYITNEKSEN